MMALIELDTVDYRLLSALQRNSRTPLKELARIANVSVPTARSRIQRLTDMSILRFTIALDLKKIVGGVSAFILLKARFPELKIIAETLKEMEEVSEVHLTSGEHDLIIKVSVPDMRAYEDFIMRKLTQVPGIEYSRSTLIVESVKEQYGPSLRPGYGIRMVCTVCKKRLVGELVKYIYEGREYFFCCQSCASLFRKERGQN